MAKCSMSSFKEERCNSGLPVTAGRFHLPAGAIAHLSWWRDSMIRMISSPLSLQGQKAILCEWWTWNQEQHCFHFIISWNKIKNSVRHWPYFVKRAIFMVSTFSLASLIFVNHIKPSFIQLDTCGLLKQIEQMINCDKKSLRRMPMT